MRTSLTWNEKRQGCNTEGPDIQLDSKLLSGFPQFCLATLYSQDDALPHWAHIVGEFLDIHFPGRCVGRDGLVPWPRHSPNITPLNFFLCGYVKDNVYKNPVTSLDELKLRIVATIETVAQEMLGITLREIEYRLNNFHAKKGAHVEVV
jgi:hypothetical protein